MWHLFRRVKRLLLRAQLRASRKPWTRQDRRQAIVMFSAISIYFLLTGIYSANNNRPIDAAIRFTTSFSGICFTRRCSMRRIAEEVSAGEELTSN